MSGLLNSVGKIGRFYRCRSLGTNPISFECIRIKPEDYKKLMLDVHIPETADPKKDEEFIMSELRNRIHITLKMI